MKKVVVTGGAGFIGSNLVKYLIKKKYFVINIDKLSYSANPYNLKNLSKNKNYVFYKLDLNNKNKILKIEFFNLLFRIEKKRKTEKTIILK